MTATAAAQTWTIQRALGWAAVLAFGFALGIWLRYWVIQPEDIGIACGQADAPGWCAPRQWLILGQHYRVWGWVAVVAGAAGLLLTLPARFARAIIVVACVFSALALILYNATLGAPALVLALLALLRRR